jgi:integrase
MVFSGPFASEIASGTPRQAVFFGNSPLTLGVADDSSLTRGAAKIVRFFSTKNRMPQPFRLYRRRNDTYYLEDAATGKQTSLRTKSKSVATQRLTAHTQAAEQPCLNLTMAKAYLSAKSPEMLSRTWGEIMDDMAIGYKGSTRQRWAKVIASAPFRLLAPHPLLSTDSSHFFAVLRHPRAGVSTNVWLRILHNRALDMGWLLAPVLHKKVWPKIRYKPRRGITLEEHRKIVAAEHNPDYRLYYEVLWETGGSQTDIASLHRDQVDTRQGVIMYQRKKLEGKGVAGVTLVIGPRLQSILNQLPQDGWLFPELRHRREGERAARFCKVCARAKIEGVSLHSYRYGWAERACEAGMPEREAMAHLGHKSAAIHRAYAKRAKNVTMPLEYYEEQAKQRIVQFHQAA